MLKKGDKVDYHGIIGGPVTQHGLTMLCEPFEDSSGHMVTFVTEKSGYVSMEALTPAVDSLDSAIAEAARKHKEAVVSNGSV